VGFLRAGRLESNSRATLTLTQISPHTLMQRRSCPNGFSRGPKRDPYARELQRPFPSDCMRIDKSAAGRVLPQGWHRLSREGFPARICFSSGLFSSVSRKPNAICLRRRSSRARLFALFGANIGSALAIVVDVSESLKSSVCWILLPLVICAVGAHC